MDRALDKQKESIHPENSQPQDCPHKGLGIKFMLSAFREQCWEITTEWSLADRTSWVYHQKRTNKVNTEKTPQTCALKSKLYNYNI